MSDWKPTLMFGWRQGNHTKDRWVVYSGPSNYLVLQQRWEREIRGLGPTREIEYQWRDVGGVLPTEDITC